MADKDEGPYKKSRGPYKKYVRHFNPYEFEAARRAKKRQATSRGHQQLVLSDNSDDEFDLISSYKSPDMADKDAATTATNSANDLRLLSHDEDIEDPLYDHEIESTPYQPETEDRALLEHEIFEEESHRQDRHEELEEMFINDDEGSDEGNDLSKEDETMYGCFLNDGNSCSDGFSDYEDINSDIESTDGCEPENDDDDLLYSNAPITATSSVVLLLSFVSKHKLTHVAFKDLLAVIEAHCPKPNNCQTTVKKLLDFVSQAKGNIVKHFFCGYCKAYHGKTEVMGNCNICGKQLEKTHEHFIEVPLVKQLQNYYADPEFVCGLKYRFERAKNGASDIEDVYDGSLYQKQFAAHGVLSEPYNISLKLNTDGVAVFRSSQFGVWPLFLLVNELPPSLRTKNKYRIFGGLWFGEEKPFFSTFFKPFVDTLRETEIHGIDVVLPDGRKVKPKVIALSSHFDLPARAGVLDQVTYTGHNSCCYCNEHGEVIKIGIRGHVMTFPFQNTATGHAELRTAEGVRAHSYDALETDSTVHGFKAPSPLLQLPSFNIVSGNAIDAMHCVFLGVVKQLIGLWFTSKHSGQRWYCGNSVKTVDKRLLGIKPPNVITRAPRSIEHHVKFWKATEYRNWLFYYSLPCMKGILDKELYQHYSLLVGGIFLLSGKCVSSKQLEKAGKLLIHFVEMFDAYYDPRYVLMNHHMLLHLKKSVIDHGPLWTSSLFVFEDWNGDIGGYFHGTQHVASQIMSAVTSLQQLPHLVNKMPSGPAKDLVLQLQGRCDRSNRTPLKQGFYAIGAMKSKLINAALEDDLLSFLGLESLSTVQFFTRLQAGDTIFHSRMYKRVSRRNSFTIAYRKEQTVVYGQIEVFFNVQGDSHTICGAVVVPLLKSLNNSICEHHNILGMTAISHIVALNKPNKHRSDIVQLDDFVEMCVFMELADNMQYVAHFPNRYEKD